MSTKTVGEQVSDLLHETGWRPLAEYRAHKVRSTLEVYMKNGRLIIVQYFGKLGRDGADVYYPSSQQSVAAMIAEANAYATDATIMIASNRV